MVLNLRHFAPSTEALDQAWCSCASTGEVWTPTGHGWGTENGPIQVSNQAGMLGVQKPGKTGVSNPHTAATEKIVADLAYVIGLPVPPVTLCDRGMGTGDPRYVAVSAWAFRSPATWEQAEAMLTTEQRAVLIPVASSMVPFEMWIGASDRQNGGNVLIDGDLAPVRCAWIDYAFSLDHVWKGNSPPVTDVAPIYPAVGAVDGAAAKAIAERIVRVENVAIEGIVNRIPAEYLPAASAANIVRNLVARKQQVIAVL